MAKALAESMLNHGLAERTLLSACKAVFGRRYRFAKTLVKRVLNRFRPGSRPSRRQLQRFLENDVLFIRANFRNELDARRSEPPPRRMIPAQGAPQEWKIPSLLCVADVAEWAGEEWNHLLWLADPKRLERKGVTSKLQHYRRRWIAKRDGSPRLIESPKLRLKIVQRRILHEILDLIPANEAAHGFRAKRSALTYAAPHTGQEIVLRMDLEDFFPRIRRSRIVALFLTAGYPEPVAEVLADLCCTATPGDILHEMPGELPMERRWSCRKMYAIPHLPQGSPASPALANLSAFKLDCRVAGLAKAAGAQYTRYADDLTFSGGREFARAIERFQIRVAAIALEEGFYVNHRKTRIMRRSVSQRAAGLILNAGLNIPRDEFDRLKATLHNAVKHGLESQNRDRLPDFRAHLAGRIAHMKQVAPARAERLLRLFEQIESIC